MSEATQEEIKKLKVKLKENEEKCARLQLELDDLQRDKRHLQQDLAQQKSLESRLVEEVEVRG